MHVSRDGRGEICLTDAQKNRILGLARKVPRDELPLGLQLERGWEHVKMLREDVGGQVRRDSGENLR